MDRIVGFSINLNLTEEQLQGTEAQVKKLLNYFPWLNSYTVEIGESIVHVWGHGDLKKCIDRHQNGSFNIAVGVSGNVIPWDKITTIDWQSQPSQCHQLLPGGRFLLLSISDRNTWSICNDWAGSIPVFHAQQGEARIAASLDTLITKPLGYGPDDFFLPGLVSMLLNASYMGDWTLFKGMKCLPADCYGVWSDPGLTCTDLRTVVPSEEGWGKSRESLVGQLYERSRQGILADLAASESWTIPVSGGLDSRLIAAVGATTGKEFKTVTFGAPDSTDAVFSKKISGALNLPWERFEMPRSFVENNAFWGDWFGSSRDFHGAYHVDFLSHLRSVKASPVLIGYMGGVLSGENLKSMLKQHCPEEPMRSPFIKMPGALTVDEVKGFFSEPIDNAIEAIKATIQADIDAYEGGFYQKLMMLDTRQRQRLYISYHPTICDYYLGAQTPYLDVEYARFCFALPRLALDDRWLLKEVFRRYYPSVASISNNSWGLPMQPQTRYLLKRKVAMKLPPKFRVGPLKDFGTSEVEHPKDAFSKSTGAPLWPFDRALDSMGHYFDRVKLGRLYDGAIAGNYSSYKKLAAFLPAATHFSG